MTKRIVSGVFILVALGALGLILAGALTSGEQLIVRFLTAIIVAALGLYVISDLRLQADDDAVASGRSSATSAAGDAKAAASGASGAQPARSDAFMATVTGKKPSAAAADAKLAGTVWANASGGRSASESNGVADDGDRNDRTEPELAGGELDTSQLLMAELDPADLDAHPLGNGWSDVRHEELAAVGRSSVHRSSHGGSGHRARGEGRNGHQYLPNSVHRQPPPQSGDGSPYEKDVVPAWPLTPDGRPVDDSASIDLDDDDEVTSLVKIFAQQDDNAPEADEQANDGSTGHDQAAYDHLDHESADDQPAGPDPVDHEAAYEQHEGELAGPDLIDHEQRDTELAGVEGPGHEDAGTPSAPCGGSPVLSGSRADIEPASSTGTRLTPVIDLRGRSARWAEIDVAIKSGELDIISSLIDQGMLSTEGPISDRDVTTMVYVAFTSNELRKILLVGGTLDGDNSGIDLGPVELFDNETTWQALELGGAEPGETIDLSDEQGPSSGHR